MFAKRSRNASVDGLLLLLLTVVGNLRIKDAAGDVVLDR